MTAVFGAWVRCGKNGTEAYVSTSADDFLLLISTYLQRSPLRSQRQQMTAVLGAWVRCGEAA